MYKVLFSLELVIKNCFSCSIFSKGILMWSFSFIKLCSFHTVHVTTLLVVLYMDIPLLVLSSKGGEFIMLYTIIFLAAIPLLTSATFVAIYKSLSRSQIEYCCSGWSHRLYSNNNLKTLESIQIEVLSHKTIIVNTKKLKLNWLYKQSI